MRRRLKLLAIFAAAFVLLVVLRLSWGGRYEMQLGAQVSSSKVDQALLHYGRAIRWYFPGSPWAADGVAALQAVAGAAEERGDLTLALKAYRTLQAALTAVRSFYQPYASTLAEVRIHMAHLIVMQEPAAHLNEAKVLAQLNARRDPHMGWSLLTLLTFFTWVGGVVAFIFTGFAASGNFVGGRRSALWGGVTLGAFLLWTLSCWMA